MKTNTPVGFLALASYCAANARLNEHGYAATKGGIAGWLYDRGIFGSYPSAEYASFATSSPQMNHVRKDDRCDDGLVFVTPYGSSVGTPGPMIVDNDGNLVWVQTSWGHTADLKVQKIGKESYITFWHNRPSSVGSGGDGQGVYAILDHSYRLVREVRPAGGLTGDFHEFKLTDDGTALITVYNRTKTDMHSPGAQQAWIIDSVFQEVNVTSGALIFEWRASEYFIIQDTLRALRGGGGGSSRETALDFFHINSVDKDKDGNYLVSSANMKTIICIGSQNGNLLWQLGGGDNSFRDLSSGAATRFSRTSDVRWHDNSTITLFDNNHAGKSSRGVVIEVDTKDSTAAVVQEYAAPGRVHSHSDGSMQVLPNGNVLVGWGNVPAFTEFSSDGEVLCDTHIAPVGFSKLGWVRSYRTYKFPWVGQPQTKPDVVVRPKENAVYVSWNGATEVSGWMLDAFDPEAKDEEASDATTASPSTHKGRVVVKKTGFETRIAVTKSAPALMRIAALDMSGNVMAWTKPVFRDTETASLHLPRPDKNGQRTLPAATVLCALIGITIVSIGALISSRWMIVACTTLLKSRRRIRLEYEYRTLAKSDKGLV